MASADKPVAKLDSSLAPRLPTSSITLFDAKKEKNLTFEAIAKKLGRDEVAVAALFYGQAMANAEDIKNLSDLLNIPADKLESQLAGHPDRGRTMDMPPKEPLIYRLYEIVQNYGYAYKAVLNEKFGDGIMSAISFSTNVKKETDDKGDWVVITLRGKCSSTPLTSQQIRPVKSDDVGAWPAVTKPAPPSKLNRLSIVPPTEIKEGIVIRSPSGRILTKTDYANHPDRPLSMQERQEAIKTTVEKKMSFEGSYHDYIDRPAKRPRKRFRLPHIILKPSKLSVRIDTSNMAQYEVAENAVEVEARKILCTYLNCNQVFEDEIMMKKHKISCSNHDYCRKCDLDFPDYDSHLSHRVESDAHITCDRCGQDFGSDSGLNRHKKQVRWTSDQLTNVYRERAAANTSHPVDQNIVCKDCGVKFVRAAAYVRHIESGHCRKNANSHHQLEANKQHKHIVRKILENPEQFNFRVGARPGMDIVNFEDDDDEEDSETTGGVSIETAFDEDEEQKRVTYESLRPTRPVVDLMSFDDKDESHQKPSSKGKWPTPAEAAGADEGSINEPHVAKAIKSLQEWESALAFKDQEHRASNEGNLMQFENARIYNPDSRSYDPYRFWDTQFQAFRCPYPECDENKRRRYDSAMEITQHMVDEHTVNRIRCPTCFKHFQTSAALMSHCEAATGRCRIQRTRDFGVLIDNLSGGFLTLSTEEGENDEPMFEAQKPSSIW
ncbi:MAG: hypothetical protein Q9165_000804 [Trypethelium subeluteriae]